MRNDLIVYEPRRRWSRLWLAIPVMFGLFVFVGMARPKQPIVERIIERVVEVPVTVQKTSAPIVRTADYRVTPAMVSVDEPAGSNTSENTNNKNVFNFHVSGTGNSVVVITGNDDSETETTAPRTYRDIPAIVTASKAMPEHCVETRQQYEATVAKWNSYFE